MKIKSPSTSGIARNGHSSYTARFFLVFIFLFALGSPPVGAALPFSELWREDLLDNVIGFGRNTIGGKGGTLCRVTNLNNSGTGSLRACAEAIGPQWIKFDVSGTITTTSEILVKSNKTIDGRGQDITISGYGFIIGFWHVAGGPTGGNVSNNVIIHNLKIKNIIGNAGIVIGEDASNVWLDHITMQNMADEMFYIGSGAGNHNGQPPHSITMSWNACLVGTTTQKKCLLISDPVHEQDADITLTLHHNFYDRVTRRLPLASWATIHSFNNYYNQNEIAAQLREFAKFFSENDIFRRLSSSSYPMVTWQSEGGAHPFDADNTKVLNPWLIDGAVVREHNASTIFHPGSFYSYTLDTANAALQTAIVNGAGWQNVTIPILPVAPVAPTNLSVK